MRSYFIIVIGIIIIMFVGNGVCAGRSEADNGGGSGDIQASHDPSNDNDNPIVNEGEIRTRTLFTTQDDIEVINNGTIDTDQDGILTHGDRSNVTNNSLIKSESTGMKAENSNNSTLINNGKILSTYFGMEYLAGDDADIKGTMINNDEITINAPQENLAIGMTTGASNSTITNTGIIKITGGFYSSGMEVFNRRHDITNTTLNNTGTIIVGGAVPLPGDPNSTINNGIGIESFPGQKHTINNSGTIIVYGERAWSIAASSTPAAWTSSGGNNIRGGDETVNLFPGSDITGNIFLAGGNDILNIFAGSILKGDIYMGAGDDKLSLSFDGMYLYGDVNMGEGLDTIYLDVTQSRGPHIAKSFSAKGNESMIISGQMTGAVNNNAVTTIDPTEQAVKSSVLSSLTSGLHRTIGQRLDTLDKKNVWFQGIYWDRDRDNEGDYFGYDHNVKGGMGGVEGHIKNARFGAIAGIASGEVDSNPSFETESDSYFAGIYSQIILNKIVIRASFLTGYEDHDTERYISNINRGGNIDTSTADFDSIFITPGIGIKADLEVNKSFTLIPSLDLSHSVGWYESYRYSDTENANISVDNRTLQAFNGILKLKAVYEKEWFAIGGHVGGTGRFTDDDDVDGRFGSSNYSYDIYNDDSVYGVIGGGYLNVAFSDNFHLNLNADHIESDGSESQNNFTFGLQARF